MYRLPWSEGASKERPTNIFCPTTASVLPCHRDHISVAMTTVMKQQPAPSSYCLQETQRRCCGKGLQKEMHKLYPIFFSPWFYSVPPEAQGAKVWVHGFQRWACAQSQFEVEGTLLWKFATIYAAELWALVRKEFHILRETFLYSPGLWVLIQSTFYIFRVKQVLLSILTARCWAFCGGRNWGGGVVLFFQGKHFPLLPVSLNMPHIICNKSTIAKCMFLATKVLQNWHANTLSQVFAPQPLNQFHILANQLLGFAPGAAWSKCQQIGSRIYASCQ